jgi:hypothetical protein
MSGRPDAQNNLVCVVDARLREASEAGQIGGPGAGRAR